LIGIWRRVHVWLLKLAQRRTSIVIVIWCATRGLFGFTWPIALYKQVDNREDACRVHNKHDYKPDGLTGTSAAPKSHTPQYKVNDCYEDDQCQNPTPG
jgi:hypothetical protein